MMDYEKSNNRTTLVMGTTGIKDTYTASLYELAINATRSVSGQCWEVKGKIHTIFEMHLL